MKSLLRWGLTLSALWIAADHARAEVAYLRNGRSIEISSFKVKGENVALILQGGGEMALPLREVLEIRRQPAEVRAAGPAAPDTLVDAGASGGAGSAVAAAPPTSAPADLGDSGAEPVAVHDDAVDDPSLPAGGVFDRAALRDMAGKIARRHGVDEALVHAVIQVESRYNAFAVSPRGAMGLMQLMPKTADRFDVDNAFDPVENVDAGVRYLKELLERYSGQKRLALAAYNAGEEAVERYSGIPPYRETIDYVRRVLGQVRR
jgi:soluble lytic murein transglycosylase-like protein